MTSAEIRSAFPSWTPVIFYDVSYAKPTSDYLLNHYAKWFKGWLGGFGLGKWKRWWDCDDFALMYVAGCKVAHAQTLGIDADSLAVGIFCYTHAKGAHAIVTAFTDEGQIFIEPQTGQRIALTPQEIQSCFSASF